MTTLDENPWATDQPPEPRSLTRQDRIEAAARANARKPADHEWTEDDLEPLGFGNGGNNESAVDIWRRFARLALDAAYPELTTAAELDALPHHAVLIGAGGIAWERVVSPGNTLVRQPDRCWARQEWTTTRISSAELVRNGETYVLVHRAT